MTLPIIYRSTTEKTIADYDFIDLAQATAVKILYAGNVGGISGAYVLSPQKFYSDEVTKFTQAGSNIPTLIHEVDFDMKFQVPVRIEGNTVVTIPYGIKAAVASLTSNTYMAVRLRKWDGTTETDIFSVSGALLTEPLTNIGDYIRDMCAIPLLIPKTDFKKNETLRLTVEQWGYCSADNQAIYFFGHDPYDRNSVPDAQTIVWNNEPSILECQIPFRISL